MTFKIIASLVVLLPAAWGVFLLVTPGDRLIEIARRAMFGIRLPMPKEGSTGRKLLVGFYKTMGVIALAFSAFVIFILCTHSSK